ncbi:MAG TPA: ROK family protein [Mariprofundaceae bacterium]|nr:ROK family protein [Mariprofundaceae bacterium]
MNNHPEVLAADIGGTNIRLARVLADGSIAEEVRVQTALSRSRHDNPESARAHILETLCSACRPLLDGADVDAMGIGFPGFFIGNSGILASSPNLPQLHDFALAEELGNQLGIKVSAQNDALCAAIGEQRFGAGMGSENLLHVTLGTGVGGGLILNREAYTGEHGMAMEFGHLRIVRSAEARACGCGGKGCVEPYASANAVAEQYAIQTSVVTDSRSIHKAACKGDAAAISVLQEAGSYLGQALAEAVKLLDIETVTISGGLTGAWDILYTPLMEQLNGNLIPPLKNKIRVLCSTLDDRGGLLGAATIAGVKGSPTQGA